MELHTCLWNDVEAFDFDEDDFESLTIHFPDLQIKTHRSVDDFLATAHQADFIYVMLDVVNDKEPSQDDIGMVCFQNLENICTLFSLVSHW